jgi:methylated-DNA-[protein]-cysteine S-methyltransferase
MFPDYTKGGCATLSGMALVWTIAECAPGVTLRLTASRAGLRSIDFDPDCLAEGDPDPYDPVLQDAARQLRDYFAGGLRVFSLPLDPQGTDFQKRVWRELETIAYGEIRSYSQVASAIGAPKAVRAVGAANGSNPIPIVIPCHRVIGSSGKLVGYGGGLPLKRRLLDLESARGAVLFHR